MRRSFLSLPVAVPLLAFALFVPPPAHAVSKEIIQLQTQVQQLSDMLQHLQETNDEHMGVLQHLVEQSIDNVNKMSQQMTALQGQIEQNTKNDTLPGQIQALNDSVDELKNRMGVVNKQLTDIQSQLQNVQSQPASGTQAPAGAPQGAAGQMPSGSPDAAQGAPAGASQTSPGAAPNYGPTPRTNAPIPGAASDASTEQLYQSALRDYNGARYELASSEFAEVLKNAPGSPSAGNAGYYLGEISYRQGLYAAAINYYDIVLEQFSGSGKAPAAQLRKAQAEFATQKREAGIRDLRSLIQRYPTAPESAQARSLLNGMGVRIVPSKPSPGR